MIETIENRFPGRDYLVELGAPEFTSICPLTDAPDFGELTIRYVPEGKLYELKSLRDYLTPFRERRIFQEEVVNEVLEQLRRYRCDYAQGYFISPPLEKALLREWLLDPPALGAGSGD